jgi:hypothetical protein
MSAHLTDIRNDPVISQALNLRAVFARQTAIVIEAFRKWVGGLGKSPVFVASPLVTDYPFIKWYLHRFGGEQLFEDFEPVQRTLDLASFTAGKLNIPLAQARRMNCHRK